MDGLGPSIFWVPIIIGRTEGPVPIRTGVVALGGHYNTIFVPLSRPARVIPIEHRRVFENTCSAAGRAREDILMEN